MLSNENEGTLLIINAILLNYYVYLVCSIVCSESLLIITGSWDQTAKVWADKENIATLHAHEVSIWSPICFHLNE